MLIRSFAVAVLASWVSAQASAQTVETLPGAFERAADQIVAEAANEQIAGGSIAFVQDGQVVGERRFGMAGRRAPPAR